MPDDVVIKKMAKEENEFLLKDTESIPMIVILLPPQAGKITNFTRANKTNLIVSFSGILGSGK